MVVIYESGGGAVLIRSLGFREVNCVLFLYAAAVVLTVRNNATGEPEFKLFPLRWFQTVDCSGSDDKTPDANVQITCDIPNVD